MSTRVAFILMLPFLAGPIDVHAQRPSAQSPPTWRLELYHAIRPGEQLPAMLGNVTNLSVLDDGTVYVVEEDPPRVTQYGKSGEFVRVMMREGGGPGETRAPVIATHGDTLFVYDSRLGRLSRQLPSGRMVSERRLDGGMVDGPLWVTAEGQVLILADFLIPGADGGALRIAPNGRIDTVTWTHSRTEDRVMSWKGPNWVLRGRTPFSPYGVATFDPAGRLVLGGSRRSQWFVIVAHDTIQTVTLPEHEILIASRVRDSAWTEWFDRLPKTLPQFADIVRKERFPTTLPPWVSFDIDRRGDWWIGRPGPDGGLSAWDIVDNQRMVGHIAAPPHLVRARVNGPVMAFGTDIIALLHEADDGTPWIGVYRVIRGAN